MIDDPANFDTEGHCPNDELYVQLECNFGSLYLYGEDAKAVCDLVRCLVIKNRNNH